MFSFAKALTILFAVAFIGVQAERHVVHFDNRCQRGTPTLVRNGQILSSGWDYVADGVLDATIAYLQTGNCGLNGEGCTTVELTLKNPNCPGCGSSVDISMIPPYVYILAWNGVSTGFGYYSGCDGAGANCNGPNCNTAFHGSNDNWVQVQCENNDVNLAVTFCM
ncbi:glycopeptide [Pluteus cervinus]|uniref:Glycopeptide n=1 Tax=Pluteus cervinus TaxID=181527 RepID=A0ACD3AJ75_9AGAR|nr:glycopeptide [Pluteus cervinus]